MGILMYRKGIFEALWALGTNKIYDTLKTHHSTTADMLDEWIHH